MKLAVPDIVSNSYFPAEAAVGLASSNPKASKSNSN